MGAADSGRGRHAQQTAAPMSPAEPSPPSGARAGPASQWSLVLALDTEGAEGAPALQALGELALRYIYPTYAFVRRRGQAPAQAQLSVQGFLASLARIGTIGATSSSFRCFLLAELMRFLQDGPATALAGPLLAAPQLRQLEDRYTQRRDRQTTPDIAFDHDFARELVHRARLRLRREAEQAGRSDLFEHLAEFLTREPPPGAHESVSQQLGVPPLTVASAIRRLRQRFRELVERELAETVADQTQLATERHLLHQALRDSV